jgi:hypothetical protein
MPHPRQVRGRRLSSRITSPKKVFVELEAMVERPIPGFSMTRLFAPLGRVSPWAGWRPLVFPLL